MAVITQAILMTCSTLCNVIGNNIVRILLYVCLGGNVLVVFKQDHPSSCI